jgi:predicted transposase/invertase (TIGR01784 family)
MNNHAEKEVSNMTQESYPLTHDLIFKSVFGRERNTCILISLINTVLGNSLNDRIEKAIIINPFHYGEGVDDRTAVLDIRAVDGTGCHYNIEMQVDRDNSYIKRALFYLNDLYIAQLHINQDFEMLNRTIGISFVCFPLFPERKKLHSRFRLIDPDEYHEFDIEELHLLELAKFRGESVDSLLTPIDKWLHVLKYSLKYATIETEIPQTLREEEGIEMTIDEYRKTVADQKVLNMIRLREKSEHIYATKMCQARREGLAEGEAKGKAEGKIEAAQKLLQSGLAREEIARRLELPEDGF